MTLYIMEHSLRENSLARIKKDREVAFYRSMKRLNGDDYIGIYFLFCSAPVLAGVKPSVLISIKSCYRGIWNKKKEQLMSISGLSVKELCVSEKSISVLIYNADSLKTNLDCPIAKDILKSHGYPDGACLSSLLHCLENRLNCTEDCLEGNCFPHEIGIFLGYPPRDVSGFIEKGGKDYICCRYWKVYHDKNAAEELFMRIDKAKEFAISVLMLKLPLIVAIKMLTNMRAA